MQLLDKLIYGTRVFHAQAMQNARVACCLSSKVTCACWAPLGERGANFTLIRPSNFLFDLSPALSHWTTW